MKNRLNPMLFIAGIGVGIFAYSMFAQSREPELPQAELNSILATDDLSELKARLVASQKRVSRLESMLSMATVAENKLSTNKRPGKCIRKSNY